MSLPLTVTATVFNLSQLLAAIAAAPDVANEASRTIAVAGPAGGGSSYVSAGRLVIPSQTRAYPVIVRAADYSDKPLVPIVSQNAAAVIFGGTGTPHPIDIGGWTGLEFRGFEFYNDDTACSQSAATYWFAFGDCSNVTFRQCYFHQVERTLSVDVTAADTTIANMGGWTNLTVEDCVFNRISRGFLPTGGSPTATFTRNSFLRTYNHAFEMAACASVSINFNLFDGFHPGYVASSGNPYINHADTVLGYINSSMRWAGFDYSDNFAIELRDFFRYSFQLENGTASASNATGIVIRRNVHIGGIDNPMFLISAQSAQISDNEMHWITGSAEVTSARIRAQGVSMSMSGNDTGWLDSGGNSITGTTPSSGSNPVGTVYNGTAISAVDATAARDAFAALHLLRTQDDIA